MARTAAPCGHEWRFPHIVRTSQILFPTAFVDCKCTVCNETWTERYEFDFSVPLGGLTIEESARRNQQSHEKAT